MSFRLLEEVLAGMPPDATLAERNVLMVLAHHADERTRECWPGVELLCARTGLHPDSLRRTLTKLERRGIQLRVQRSAPGRRTVYRIPVLAPEHPDATSAHPAPEHPDVASYQSPEHPDVASAHSSGTPGSSVGNTRILRREHPDATSAPEGQEPSKNRQPRAREVTEMRKTERADPLDAALAVWSDTHPGREREALAIALQQESRRGVQVAHPAGYFATWARDRRAAIRLPTRTHPPCSGCGGDGWQLDPTTNKPIAPCPTCKPRRSATG